MQTVENIPRRMVPGGIWKPHKFLGGNVTPADMPHPIYFYCNGDRIDDASSIGPYSAGLREYKVYSVYHNSGQFWCANVNALRSRVGTGRDPESEGFADDHGDEDDLDWEKMGFNYTTDHSYAVDRGEHQLLQHKRPDQVWMQKLLPGHFHESLAMTYDSTKGGVNGELPLLLALIGFCAAPNPQSIIQGYTGSLRNGRLNTDYLKELHRIHMRGMVVTVYHNGVGLDEHQIAYSRHLLEKYEKEEPLFN